MSETILVTGGAGYIGSHVVKQLGEAGHAVVVLDNLSSGFAESVLHGDLVVGSTGDRDLVMKVLHEHQVTSVMHFAANLVVPESVARPLLYYANNTCSSRNLLECCVDAGVKRFIFSSTAAVYGTPDAEYADEQTPVAPLNPYGHSKLMTEQMLKDVARATGLSYVVLRYFNVAGADRDGRIGQRTANATHLIKVACETALGKRDSISVFGTDYPTPDGTGVRDYIHVDDLAAAHLEALTYLRDGGQSDLFNCGYGRGYSVREVISSVERSCNSKLRVIESPRREGDSARVVARSDKLRDALGWTPRHDDLDYIVGTALDFERKLD